MKKRVLSLLMALTLCLTTLPTAVFADVTENGEGSGGTHYVAESGGTQYETVQEILDNMEEGEITLLDSVTEDLTVSAATTIHMNGHSITGNIDATDSLTLNGGTVDGTVKVDGGTLNMTAPSDAAAAIDGGLNVVSGSAFVSGAQVGVKGTLYFDGTDMLISGAVKAVELDSAAEPAAKTLYGSATPAAPSLTLTETSKSLTAGKTAVFTANYTGTDTLNAYVQSNAVNGCFTISQKNNGDGTYTVSVKIDEETPGGTYTLFVHELGNTSVQASATITVTGLPDAAEVNGKQYKSLPRALDAAQDGDTVKLLADHTTNWSDVEAGEYATLAVVKKTLTLDLNGMTVDYLTVGDVVSDEEGGILDSYDGNLTVVENVQGGSYGKIKNLEFVKGSLAIQGGRIGDFDGSKLTCKENSGTVTISGGMVCNATVGDGATVTVSGGTMHQGEWVNNGTLNIKGGTFGAVNFHNNSGTIAISGGTFSTLKNYDNTSSFPIAPISLLAPGHAFYKDNTVQDGSRRDFLQDVTVKEHTHTMVNNKCACGFSCTHTNTEGASTIGEDGKCTACGTQFAAGIGETYYTDVPSALDAATDGQTVKLLANTMLPSDTYVSKTLTLDLDGHSLSGYSLNVGGLTPTSQVRTGKLTVIDSSGGNGAVGVTVRDGGTLVFDPKNDHTTLLQLEVWGGTVELYGGKISRSGLQLNNGITLGDLLPQKAGLAYYRDDTQLTLKEAASQTCDLVVKSCSHGGKNGFDNNSATCPYCGAPAVAETALYNGEGNRPWRRFADLQTALDADRDGGATLKLLADVTGDYTIGGTKDTGLDLNDHSIKGTVTVKTAAGSNTTTLSNTKNTTTVSIDKVVAYKGAKLAGSKYPAVIGELTLAEGATWKTILNDTALGYKVLNADGTHKWYARDDVKDSQLNNVIINRLPITRKDLSFKVDGTNVKGNKVERGTTVQLCASCNAKDVTVAFSILKTGETTPITLSGNDVQYTTVGTGTTKFYVAEYAFNDVDSYTISFTATKDGYTVTSNHKKLTVTKPNLSNAEITFRSSNESTYEPYRSTTTAPGFTVTYNGKTLKLGVDYTASGTASSAGVSTQTLTIKAVEGSDYTGSKTAEWRIVPHKAKVEVGDVIKAYDGTTDLPDGKISLVSAAGSAGYQAGLPLPLSEGNGFELTDAKYDSANASETEKNISFTVKLTDTNYTFEDGTTEKAFTLNGADFDDKTFQINKATAPSSSFQPAVTVINDLAKTYEMVLFSDYLPKLSSPCEYGTVSYSLRGTYLTDGYKDTVQAEVVKENSQYKLKLTVPAVDYDKVSSVGTIDVRVTSDNYRDFYLTIGVKTKNKDVPVPDGTISASDITYGQALNDSKIAGKMKAGGKAIDGTFTWTNGTFKPAAGDYPASWTFTPAEGYEEYATATGTVTVKVAPKSIEGATITLKKREFTYNAAEQSPTITGVTLKDWSETITTYDIVSGDKAINANDSITLTIKGTGNYTGTATAEWKIIPAKLTVSVPSEVKKEYDGTTNATVTPTFNGLRGKDNLTAADYSVTAAFDNAKVGYKKTVIGKVTLNQTETAKNYVLTNDGNFSTDDGTITKAVAPTVQPVELTIYNGVQADYYVDLPSLPDMGKGKSYGTVGYRKTHTINLSEGYKAQSDLRADPENLNTLRLLLHMTQTGSLTGEIGTVTIPVTTSNYQDITLTVKISAKNRITPTGTPTLSKNAIIYGDALNTIALSGKLHDNVNNVDVDGTFEWVDGTHIPVVGNGTYAAEWIFEPTDTEKYLTVSGRSNITVEKARQYGKLSMAGYTYGKTPSTPTLTDQTGDLNAQVTYSYAAADSGSVQTWDISNPPALNAGTYRMYASIGDTDNYYGFEAVYCEFVVAKATPTYTVPTGLTAKYGQTLADVTLPDGWSWMDSSESVGGASTAAKTFQAKFTPKDTENYNTVENIELEVTVNKADGGNFKTVELEQKYTDASDHTYTPDWAGLPAGQDWTFSSEASIVLPKQDFAADGNLLTYAISGGKAGDKITLILKASCDNYENFTITLNVTLTEKDDQKPLTITGNTSVIYGEKLTLTTTGGSGMGAVTYRIDNAISTGEATIDPNTGVLTPVKVGSVSVIATKAGDNNYNDVTSAPFVLMIKPATPTGEPNYTIKATAGAGGSISPSGNVSVREGGDQTFTITPDKGYAVANVKIDGKSIGAVKSYTFENVSSPHTIEAIFVKGTASASTGDSSNLPLWSALLLASTLALAGAVHLKRKRAR
ncbi:YDG domain-containing protein [Hominenteromicrobium sp.]|uniref:YDG domain-containing protein n=1 Tax=Hominenteromicrobium sp. TaxID=3073581 RepID=UPI003AF05872